LPRPQFLPLACPPQGSLVFAEPQNFLPAGVNLFPSLFFPARDLRLCSYLLSRSFTKIQASVVIPPQLLLFFPPQLSCPPIFHGTRYIGNQLRRTPAGCTLPTFLTPHQGATSMIFQGTYPPPLLSEFPSKSLLFGKSAYGSRRPRRDATPRLDLLDSCKPKFPIIEEGLKSS